MRGRLILILLIATTGCTRDNPAFDAGSTGTGETDDEGSDPTTLTSAEAESNSGQEAPDPVCDLVGGIPLEIDLGPAGCSDPLEAYDRLHLLVSINGSTLMVGTCPDGAVDCSQCETDVQLPLSFAPLDLSGLAPMGACLHVQARRINPSNPDVCRFQSVVIQSDVNGMRRVLMAGRNTPGVGLPPVDNSSPLANFNPVLTYVENCPCSQFPESCCDDVSPTVYALDIGTEIVPIGNHADLEYSDSVYDFKTLDAFLSGECGAATQEAWGVILK